MQFVAKRSGELVPFDKQKIVAAIEKAMADTPMGVDTVLSVRIADEIASKTEDLSVEEIQDIVENKLMASKRKDVARAYMSYRNLHGLARDEYKELMNAVAEKLGGKNLSNQNANVDEASFGGRIGEMSRLVAKRYALEYCMSDMAKQNHLNNEIYIHDLDSYAVGMHNCYDSSTKFITQNGVKRFGDCSDGQVVHVLDRYGEWRKATVHKYGKQKMYDLVFKSGLTIKKVTCTRNHRWVLEDGSITDHINIGDSLILTPCVRNLYTEDSRLWCFGFALGDGSDFYMKSKDESKITNSGMQVRLCGKKVEHLDKFLSCGWSERQRHKNGDISLVTRGNGAFKQLFLDAEFWKLMSYNDLCNIFEGYIHADAYFAENGSVMLATSDIRMKKFIEAVSSVCGYYIWSQHEKINSTNYKENRILYEFYLVKKQSTKWTLQSISASRDGNNGYKTAWCVEEPITKTFVLDGCMTTGNCLSIPFDDLLAQGFNTRQTDVRPAQSISTAFQLVAVIFQVQSLQQFGGVSATHLDWTMVPYVRKSFYKHYSDGMKFCMNGYVVHEDHYPSNFKKICTKEMPIDDAYYKTEKPAYDYALEMTTRELYQAVEGMYHNLNTLQSRSGNQLPFTSINYGTCTLPEGRMVIKALLETSIKGIGKLHKTSIFPCGIFQMMNGVNRAPGDPNYDLYQLALTSTAQRLYPNYANVDWSGNAGYDKNDVRTYFSTMGCRTANGWDINGFGQLKDGRGNICPVTIILPTIAMEAKTNVAGSGESLIDTFMNLLDQKLHEAKDMLIERFDWICSQSPSSAKFMWENSTMAGYDGKDIRSALKHGTLAIGLLGMAETLQALIDTDQTTDEGMALAKRICQLYKDRCNEFKQEYKLNFGVYYTPAENLCYTAMQKFKDTYGVIPNVSDKEFFTNSIHVPVWKEVTPFEKIDIESQLTGYSSAGCITYTELDSTVKHNIKALETIVNYAMDHDIPYFAVNVPNDTCMTCGYCDEIGDTCPQCGGKNIQRLRRVTGYLTGDYKTAFNLGKQQEVELRIKHNRVMHR